MGKFVKWMIGMLAGFAIVISAISSVIFSLCVMCKWLGGVLGVVTWVVLLIIVCIGWICSNEVIAFADKVLEFIDKIYRFIDKRWGENNV